MAITMNYKENEERMKTNAAFAVPMVEIEERKAKVK
jgi:hypothetical protein